MKRRVKEITPNDYNATLFLESLSPESIRLLADDMAEKGQYAPIVITLKGAVIIDGERRYRAAKMLGWEYIEVIEEDIHRREILRRILDSVGSQRQMSLLEQARVYQACLRELLKQHRKGQITPLEAKRMAIAKSHFPYSVTLADQLIHVLKRGDADLQMKVLSSEMTIATAYEKLERRTYLRRRGELPPLPGKAPKPPPTPEEEALRLQREQERQVKREKEKEELHFVERYIDTHQEELAKQESQRRLLQLFEPPPAPPAPVFKEIDETQAVNEALEALAVREPPEQIVGRLAAFIENIIDSVKSVDEQRARDIVRESVKPMILRLAVKFPRQEFEIPVEPSHSSQP